MRKKPLVATVALAYIAPSSMWMSEAPKQDGMGELLLIKQKLFQINYFKSNKHKPRPKFSPKFARKWQKRARGRAKRKSPHRAKIGHRKGGHCAPLFLFHDLFVFQLVFHQFKQVCGTLSCSQFPILNSAKWDVKIFAEVRHVHPGPFTKFLEGHCVYSFNEVCLYLLDNI